ncbi:MAG TPA: sigma-70 family RNA polymerase sigma factor [Gemmata sp.]
MIDDGVKESEGTSATSLNLLARVRADDQAAWARLVALYGPLVYRWCSLSGLRGEDAADVGQDVFLAVARGIRGFRREGSGQSFRAWLFTITRNKIRDRAGGAVEAAEGGSGPGRVGQVPAAPADSSVWDDQRHLVHRTIELVRGEFEPKTWAAFWQTAVDGRGAEDVAAELGLTRAAVYLAKSRVRRRLLAEFGDLVDFGPVRPAGAEG